MNRKLRLGALATLLAGLLACSGSGDPSDPARLPDAGANDAGGDAHSGDADAVSDLETAQPDANDVAEDGAEETEDADNVDADAEPEDADSNDIGADVDVSNIDASDAEVGDTRHDADVDDSDAEVGDTVPDGDVAHDAADGEDAAEVDGLDASDHELSDALDAEDADIEVDVAPDVLPPLPDREECGDDWWTWEGPLPAPAVPDVVLGPDGGWICEVGIRIYIYPGELDEPTNVSVLASQTIPPEIHLWGPELAEESARSWTAVILLTPMSEFPPDFDTSFIAFPASAHIELRRFSQYAREEPEDYRMWYLDYETEENILRYYAAEAYATDEGWVIETDGFLPRHALIVDGEYVPSCFDGQRDLGEECAWSPGHVEIDGETGDYCDLVDCPYIDDETGCFTQSCNNSLESCAVVPKRSGSECLLDDGEIGICSEGACIRTAIDCSPCAMREWNRWAARWFWPREFPEVRVDGECVQGEITYTDNETLRLLEGCTPADPMSLECQTFAVLNNWGWRGDERVPTLLELSYRIWDERGVSSDPDVPPELLFKVSGITGGEGDFLWHTLPHPEFVGDWTDVVLPWANIVDGGEVRVERWPEGTPDDSETDGIEFRYLRHYTDTPEQCAFRAYGTERDVTCSEELFGGRCGDDCVNFMDSYTNCGECGNRCGPGELCSAGTCVCHPRYSANNCEPCAAGFGRPDCSVECGGAIGTEVWCNGRGTCDEGIDGTGWCDCDRGFHGRGCEFSCSDGMRNGDERHVDCGQGVCPSSCLGT